MAQSLLEESYEQESGSYGRLLRLFGMRLRWGRANAMLAKSLCFVPGQIKWRDPDGYLVWAKEHLPAGRSLAPTRRDSQRVRRPIEERVFRAVPHAVVV